MRKTFSALDVNCHALKDITEITMLAFSHRDVVMARPCHFVSSLKNWNTDSMPGQDGG